MIEVKLSYGDDVTVRGPLCELRVSVDKDSGEVRVRAWPKVPPTLDHIFDRNAGMLTPTRTPRHGGELLTFCPPRLTHAASSSHGAGGSE